jgi:hypothetical protein
MSDYVECIVMSIGAPTTLAADDSSGGLGVRMTFQRVIVWPNTSRILKLFLSKIHELTDRTSRKARDLRT